MAAATEADVNEIIAAMQQMQAATDYVDDQVCKMQLISGTNYRMVWSVKGKDNFPPAQ